MDLDEAADANKEVCRVGHIQSEAQAASSEQSSGTRVSPQLPADTSGKIPHSEYDLISPTPSEVEQLIAEMESTHSQGIAGTSVPLTGSLNAMLLHVQSSSVAPWFEDLLRAQTMDWAALQEGMELDTSTCTGMAVLLLLAWKLCVNVI